MPDTKRRTHGGARHGAGRPPKPAARTATISVKVPAALKAAYAAADKDTQAEARAAAVAALGEVLKREEG